MKHGKYRCNYYKSGTLARNRRARCAAAFVALTVGGVMAASATIPVQASDLTATQEKSTGEKDTGTESAGQETTSGDEDSERQSEDGDAEEQSDDEGSDQQEDDPAAPSGAEDQKEIIIEETKEAPVSSDYVVDGNGEPEIEDTDAEGNVWKEHDRDWSVIKDWTDHPTEVGNAYHWFDIWGNEQETDDPPEDGEYVGDVNELLVYEVNTPYLADDGVTPIIQIVDVDGNGDTTDDNYPHDVETVYGEEGLREYRQWISDLETRHIAKYAGTHPYRVKSRDTGETPSEDSTEPSIDPTDDTSKDPTKDPDPMVDPTDNPTDPIVDPTDHTKDQPAEPADETKDEPGSNTTVPDEDPKDSNVPENTETPRIVIAASISDAINNNPNEWNAESDEETSAKGNVVDNANSNEITSAELAKAESEDLEGATLIQQNSTTSEEIIAADTAETNLSGDLVATDSLKNVTAEAVPSPSTENITSQSRNATTGDHSDPVRELVTIELAIIALAKWYIHHKNHTSQN